jgi:hypothetical protein
VAALEAGAGPSTRVQVRRVNERLKEVSELLPCSGGDFCIQANQSNEHTEGYSLAFIHWCVYLITCCCVFENAHFLQEKACALLVDTLRKAVVARDQAENPMRFCLSRSEVVHVYKSLIIGSGNSPSLCEAAANTQLSMSPTKVKGTAKLLLL